MRLHAAFCIFLAALTGCATWQNTYASSAALADWIDDTHKGWSEPARARAAKCDAELPEIRTEDQVDACLGEFTKNLDVIAALEAYNAAADVLKAVLLATDPNNKDQSKVIEAWTDVLKAAQDLVVLFPNSDNLLRQLSIVTRKAPR